MKTTLETLTAALADSLNKFVYFNLVRQPLEKKMRKTHPDDRKTKNPFLGMGYTYASNISALAKAEYTREDGQAPGKLHGKTRDDSFSVPVYRKDGDASQTYLGIKPNPNKRASGKTIFAPNGDKATAEQLKELAPYLSKSSGQVDWFTVLLENIQGASIRGEKYSNETEISPCYVL
jgi:hypothetical protein